MYRFIRMKHLKYILLTLVFLFMSIGYVWAFIRLHLVLGSGDMMFHANRIEELYQDVKQGVFIPRISTYTFNQVGSGINFFYPWIFLYPFVIFRLITHNPIRAFYLGIILETFLTFCFSYYSMHEYSNSKNRAFIFSLLYTLSTYRIFLTLNQNVLAESIAYIFIPLVLVGFYETFFGNKQKWPLLGIGMSFLLYSHMLTTAIVAIYLLITLLIFWRNITKKLIRLLNAIKAAILSVALTAFYLIPFFEQAFSNNLRASWTGLTLIQQPMDVINSSINNIPTAVVGFLLIITLLLGFIYLKRVSVEDKYAYFSGLILVLLTTQLFPWGKFLKTPVANLQFPYRLNGIATAMLSIYLSAIILRIVLSLKSKYNVTIYISLIFLAVFTLGLATNSSYQIISTRINTPLLNKEPTIHNYYPIKYGSSYNLTKENWHNMFFYYGHNGAFDYFPVKVSGKINNEVVTHHALVDGKSQTFDDRLQSKPNRLEYNLSGLKAGSQIKLPILYYKNDLIRIGNGKFKKPIVSKNCTVCVKVPNKDKQVIVKYKDSFIDNISIIISIFTWLLVFYLYVKNLFLRRKNNFETIS